MTPRERGGTEYHVARGGARTSLASRYALIHSPWASPAPSVRKPQTIGEGATMG
ncbi:hypothetical protein GCM10010872_07430 [Dyella flava]|nr:hypothetical protein GCM10010872_07430 [Dyella flava]